MKFNELKFKFTLFLYLSKCNKANLHFLIKRAMNFIYSTCSVLFKKSTINFAVFKSILLSILLLIKTSTISDLEIIPFPFLSKFLEYFIIIPLKYSTDLSISSSKKDKVKGKLL